MSWWVLGVVVYLLALVVVSEQAYDSYTLAHRVVQNPCDWVAGTACAEGTLIMLWKK